jgi:hypothetical protein
MTPSLTCTLSRHLPPQLCAGHPTLIHPFLVREGETALPGLNPITSGNQIWDDKAIPPAMLLVLMKSLRFCLPIRRLGLFSGLKLLIGLII